ncbi:MAG: PQQ-binding-like beta-propeller repeat protein [Acidobacteriota bacterium]|nr:PQQ-binding-like beta-propeller repeat protein [Acidobacteriota bacterium]
MKKLLTLFLLFLVISANAQKQSTKDNWPSFRGQHAAGVADGQNLPDAWDGEKGTAIKWKVRIPGLAHSSPVVWEDKLFVTSAISSKDKATFKPGLYGAGDASDDKSVHQWKVFCLDKKSGKILWDKVAYEGVPLEKRHVKSTYASSSPTTDGRYVVAFFGSQGLYAFDMKGKLIWKKDLGRLDVGAYDLPEYEWGTASSPIIYKDLVIVQCDTSKEDFLMGINIKTGETVWKTERTEMPSWATPTVYAGKSRAEIITNAPNFIRGNDPETGKELWKLGDSSNITTPTPIFSGELIVVASGRRPNAPIFVIRPGASGDITLPKGQTTSQHVAWTRQKVGSYMPTPLIYQGLLYVLKNEGIFSCFDLATGEEKYQSRIPHQGSGFSGSPVASDGKIYLPSEDGDIFVVKAGAQFELLGKNSIGQLLMATPAISGKMMFVRGERDLFAIGK